MNLPLTDAEAKVLLKLLQDQIDGTVVSDLLDPIHTRLRRVHDRSLLREGLVVVSHTWVDRLPDFRVEPGMVGTITEIRHDFISVKMDDHVDGAEPWDNCVQFTNDDVMGNGFATASDHLLSEFKPLRVDDAVLP